MRTKAQITLSLGTVLVLIVCGVWGGDGQIDIATLPYTISSSGAYIVTRDLTLTTTNSNGITIEADNVTLDLNGHTLTGPGKTAGATGSGIYVNGTHYNITICNGTVRDWRDKGIGAGTATNSQFELLRCYNNGSNGLLVGNDNTVSGNTAHSNGTYGIQTGNGCTVNDNNSYGNGSGGIYVGSGCSVSGNSCRGNTGSGINAGNCCVITKNSCLSNTLRGISVGEGCTVSGNTCMSNGEHGILSYNGGLISENVCRNNTGDGIWVQAYCQVVNNNCNGNGYSTCDGAGIHATSTSNQIMNNHCTGNDRGLDLDAANNIVSGNTLRINTTPIDAVANNQLDVLISELPYTISLPGMYRLSGDLYLATQNTDGITISADNVTLDLNGHALIGPGKTAGTSGHAINVSGSRYNLAIRNGTIRDWRGSAIWGPSAVNSRCESLRCYNNGGQGIYLSEYATISGNSCYNNGACGIITGNYSNISWNVCNLNGMAGIKGCNGCNIFNNTCNYNTEEGIDAVNHCTITYNTCIWNSGYAGIMTGSSCTIKNNTCDRNTGDGILVTDESTVNENTCWFNGNHGIEIRSDCQVRFNTCVYNSNCGLATSGEGRGNVIELNVVNDNMYGIGSGVGGGDNFIASNRAHGNKVSDYGFHAGDSYGPIINATAGGVLPSTDYYANYRF